LGYVETILEPGERITHRAHLHWIVYWRGIVLMLIGAAFCFVGDLGDFGLVVASILIVLSAFVLLSAAIDRWSTEIVVTDQRVMMKRGLLGRTKKTTTCYSTASLSAASCYRQPRPMIVSGCGHSTTETARRPADRSRRGGGDGGSRESWRRETK
jgi:hypothetical protein